MECVGQKTTDRLQLVQRAVDQDLGPQVTLVEVDRAKYPSGSRTSDYADS